MIALQSSNLYFNAAKRMGLDPKWETDYGLMSFISGGKKNFIFFSKTPLNNQMSADLARNKHFTRVIAEQVGLPNIPYCFPSEEKELKLFFNNNKPIIGKPTLGTLSRGVQLIREHSQLFRLDFSDRIYEKYIDGVEYRFLVLMGKVIACQKKPLKLKDGKSWDLKYISLKKDEWSVNMINLSIQAAKALNLNWCAVDLIKDQFKKNWLLEVNSRPGIVHMHHPDNGEPFDIASKVIKAIIEVRR